ncbi:MAG: HAD family hydrolase [Dermatophilaceae bacterium]
MNAAELVAQAAVVLLDFDGPITPLMPPPVNAEAAETARAALRPFVGRFPEGIETTTDHLAILRYTGQHHPNALPAVEQACIDAEVTAAQTAIPTDGAQELLVTCANRGQPVAIVSNNDRACIDTFLERHHWTDLVEAIVGRTPGHPDLMKPDPASVVAALAALHAKADSAVLIGDSPGDVEASRRAGGVPAIAFVNRPSKRGALTRANPAAVLESIAVLIPAGH